MITIFKDKKDIPEDMGYVELNDLFFDRNTASLLDGQADRIIESIDEAKRIGRYKISSRFDDVAVDIDRLSTGCKTVLNVLYHPEKVFCLKECGDNALEILYRFETGYVYSEYALIPFDMGPVIVQTRSGKKVIDDHEELKEWWGIEK